MNQIMTLLIEKKMFFLGLLWEHLSISILSILIAMILGLGLGIFISEYNKSSKIILGIINFIYTIPSISLLGFLIPFSGIGNTTAVIALTIYALLPMVRNTYTGITSINEQIIEAAKGMGSTKIQILYKIKLPLAMPIIMSGLRNMATMTIALAGIASFIGAGGLGVAIYRGITTNNTAMTLVGSLLIAILAILVDSFIGMLEKRVHWKNIQSKKRNAASLVSIGVIGALIIGSTFLNASSANTIHIATKPMTEQYILGEMLKEIIEEETDLDVKLTQGVGGGTSNIQPAIEKGEFDMYPEYTGTGWNMVLKKEGLYNESMFDEMNQQYENDLNLIWDGMYGFNNTFGLAVSKQIAEKYNLKTYSDLSAVSEKLTFGAEYDFYEREDGYEALCKAYNYSFNKTVDLDIGLKYQAINQGKIDAMIIFTTDGQLSVSDVVVLEDDKQFYPSYMCGNVVRLDTLTKYPQLKSVLDKVNGLLTDKIMAQLNYKVESLGKEPKEVAHEYLKETGILK